MRVLWISLFLIGSITCVPDLGLPHPLPYLPPPPGGNQDYYEKPAGQSGYGTLPSGASYSSGNYHPSAAAGSFPSYGASSQPGYSRYYSSGSSFQPAGGAGSFTSGVQQGSQSGSTGGHSQVAQGGGGSSYDGGDKEPDFTPVSAEDQVYARKSRSHYRKSNLRYHEFVYIPTELVEPQEPTFPHHGKPSQHSKGF